MRFLKLVQNQQDADSSAKPYVLSNTQVNSIKAFQFSPDSNYFSCSLPIFFPDLYDLYIAGEKTILPWK